METLRNPELPCPYCSKTYPRHLSTCTFVDFQVMEVLLEVYTNPNIEVDGLKTIVYDFIRERSAKDLFLQAVGYVLTNDILYQQTGINEADMKYLTVRNSYFLYLWIKINILLSKKEFFMERDDSSRDKALTSITSLELLYDIQSSRLGPYSTSFNIYSLRNVSYLVCLYIARWIGN